MPIRPNSPRAAKIAARRATKASGAAGLAIPPHGAPALLNTPGAGTARRLARPLRRKEFDESKVDRDDTGKFSGSGGGGGGDKPKAEKPKKDKKPKQTPEERKAEQAKQAAANREAVGNELNAADNEQMSKAGLDGLAAIRSGAPDQNADELIGKGLAVRGRDGRVRLTGEGKKILSAADKGDTQGVLDAVSAAGDRQAARQERQAAREQKRAEREARRAERERARADKKPKSEPKPAAQPKPSGGGGKRAPEPLVGGRTLDLTGALGKSTGKAVGDPLRVVEHGGYTIQGNPTVRHAYRHAAQHDEVSQGWLAMMLERGWAERRPDGSFALRPAVVEKAMRPKRAKLWRSAYTEAKTAGYPAPEARQRARRALRADAADKAARNYERAVGNLAVFKDARGADRWAAISSTAYRDRDGEIVSTQALRGAVALADATGQSRGPLRFWHAPGLDLGDCDFQAVAADGRVLIESGTFRRPAYAAAVKAVADTYQMSIGFTHPPTEPDPAGVFHTIQIFERSLVPAGRASNPFTRITTKERTMDIAPEKLTALKALLGEQGAQELLSGARQTDKAAQAAGVAFKSSETPAVYTLPDGTPGVIVDGVFQTLKAATEKAPMAPASMMQAAMTEAADASARGVDVDPADVEDVVEAEADAITDDTDVMDLTVGDLRAVLGSIVEDLIGGYNAKMAEMKSQYEAMGKAFGAMQAQKDDSAAQAKAVTDEIASLKARLKELEGDAAPAAKRVQAAEPAAVVPVVAATTKAVDSANPVAGAYAMIFGEQPSYPIS